jgi:multicomponent Na+:H+ antiporter subunit B
MTEILLLVLLVIAAVAAVSMRNLVSAGMVLAVYSLLMAVVWTSLNAVDVAFTEASVGAGITTVLLIATISHTGRKEAPPQPGRRMKFIPVVMLLIVLALVYGTFGMPNFGDPKAPANLHVAPRYIHRSQDETAVTNMVTAVLASYRGYDTLGETTVIFTAGTCVMLLRRRRRREDDEEDDEESGRGGATR